jgi:hypothetical protein
MAHVLDGFHPQLEFFDRLPHKIIGKGLLFLPSPNPPVVGLQCTKDMDHGDLTNKVSAREERPFGIPQGPDNGIYVTLRQAKRPARRTAGKRKRDKIRNSAPVISICYKQHKLKF